MTSFRLGAVFTAFIGQIRVRCGQLRLAGPRGLLYADSYLLSRSPEDLAPPRNNLALHPFGNARHVTLQRVQKEGG